MVKVGTAPAASSEDSEVAYLIDFETGAILLALQSRDDRYGGFDVGLVTSTAFSADGRLLAFGWSGGAVEIWAADTLKLIGKTEPGDAEPTSLIFSGDGHSLIGGNDSGISVWNADTLKLTHTLIRRSVGTHVSSAGLAISQDGELVAAGAYQRAVSSVDTARGMSRPMLN
jgi:WD40 repeat protein